MSLSVVGCVTSVVVIVGVLSVAQKKTIYHSLLRQMAAQNQQKHSSKMKNIHNYRRKVLKNNKIKIRIH